MYNRINNEVGWIHDDFDADNNDNDDNDDNDGDNDDGRLPHPCRSARAGQAHSRTLRPT